MRHFDYLSPDTLDEALSVLAKKPEARILAGGTDLIVQIKDGRRQPEALLSLKRLSGLKSLHINGSLRIGAATKAGVVASHPIIKDRYSALAAGASLIGSPQIRNMATVGGNICNASPSADTAPPLLVLDAQVMLISAEGERLLPLDHFFQKPGQTTIRPGEILGEIIVPAPPPATGSFYLRHTPRAWMDIAFVGVAALLTLDKNGLIEAARIALGAVAPTPVRAVNAERSLLGEKPGDSVFEEAGRLASHEASPIDDLRASADYRRHLIQVLTRRALKHVLNNIGDNHAV